MNETPVTITSCKKEERRYLSKLFFMYFVICALFDVLQIASVNLSLLFLSYETVLSHYISIALLPAYIIIIPTAIFLLRKLECIPPEQSDMRLPTIIGAFSVCFTCLFIGSLIGTFLTTLMNGAIGIEETTSLEDMLVDIDIYEAFIMMVVIGPVVEELLFRKFLIDRLNRYGSKTAILISALMFGLYHGNITQLFYAFLAALVLGFVYEKTGTIIYTMIVHSLVNFFGSIIPMMALENEELMSAYSYLIYLFLGCGIVILSLTRKGAAASMKPGEHRAGSSVINIGSILFLLLCIAMLVYSTVMGITG